MNRHLHIVCLNVPYPPDYGGVFDLFYKIKTLHNKGVLIHLHCFDYGRGQHTELENYCVEVKYYRRKTGLAGLSFRLPYIVSSRANTELLQNLQSDNHPILLEGIHCCYFLYTGDLDNRRVFIRLHNVEFEYYRNLAKATTSFRKLFFLRESRLLKTFERKVSSKAPVLAVTEKDASLYEKYFNAKDTRVLPIFIPWSMVNSHTGPGAYCLYHGNLAVPENEKAALWIIKIMGGRTLLPLIIAGHQPSSTLQQLAAAKNVQVVADPSMKKMEELISGAHINILPSFNNTGIKIKLLNALFNGRHCVVNNLADEGSGLEALSHHANSEEEFRNAVHSLVIEPFSSTEKLARAGVLEKLYNNEGNADQLIAWLY